MSIHASKKKETLVRYLNIAQRLVVGIKAYVDSFEEIDDYLIRLQELSNEGYLIITKANNIVVEDIISYIDRTELLIKGFSLYKSLTEYLEVIVQVKNIEELLKAIRLECEKLHLTINGKKTYIVPINKGFTFLKKRILLKDSGKIVIRISRDTITRIRRKLYKLKNKLDKGTVTLKNIEDAFIS